MLTCRTLAWPTGRRASCPIDFSAIVFDLDGTLIDSAPSITAAVNTLLAEIGRPSLPVAEVRSMIGDGSQKLIERAIAGSGGALDAGALAAIYARIKTLLAAHLPGPETVYPGVRETLDLLIREGRRLAICSNKPEQATVESLQSTGLADLFGAVVGGDSLPQRKPQAEPVLAALEQLGATRHAALFVGDSHNDVEAARATGLPVVAVSYGYARVPADQLGADRVIDRFGDLPAAMASIGEEDAR